jgi:hypothetical protein
MKLHPSFCLGLVALVFSLGLLSPALASAATTTRYFSSLNINFLPNGSLVKALDTGNVYYIKNGTRSLILPRILQLWLNEAHYLKADLLIKLPATDIARYKLVGAVNPLYIGKILQTPDGKQFFIDNLLRRRPLSAAVRGALHEVSRNVYPTTVAHINQFKLGPAITRTDVHPGGSVVYNGLYHGGTVWQIEETADGKFIKHLYLQDYIYETQGYPWSSEILPIDAAELGRYARGADMAKYPDGWVVALSGNNFLVQNGTLRYLPPAIFKAMGYNVKYVLGVYPQFLKLYPRGYAVTAFKTVTAKAPAALSGPVVAPNASSTLIKVRPDIRTLIAQVNDIFLPIYDRLPTATENAFWVNYLYSGEVDTKAALVAAMSKAKSTGKLPALTSRTAVLSADVMKSKWFPYLFYFVWQLEPSAADQDYWFGRIDSGSNTIQGLGGTMEYIKETYGVTHR